MEEVTEGDYRKYSERNHAVNLFGKEFHLTKPIIKRLNPENFKPEITTLFSFQERGNWATHYLNAAYRGNFAPQIPRNMILRYSREGDNVLDSMCGSGTTLIECKLLNRNGIGVDLNKKAVLLTRNRLDFECDSKATSKTYVGNTKNLDRVADSSMDLIITHPPYANIIE